MAVDPTEPDAPRGLGRSYRLRDEDDYDEEADEQPRRAPHRKLAGRLTFFLLVLLSAAAGSLGGLMLVYSANLPQINDLERYRPSSSTDLYDRKGRLVGSFALEHRIVVNYDDFAPVLREAVLSIEDKSFESHWGINVFRIGGAVFHDIRSHGRAQGASTLTMQLARNLFLSADRTATRKIQEAYLAIQIERALTKQQIFTLYGNQIYLGHGQYGFEAASEFYFSKHAKDLTLTEAALLAGLPKGPSSYSPLINPDKATKRRNLVISEMEEDGKISHNEAEVARQAPLGLHIQQPEGAVAPWFQEAVRRELEKRFGTEEVHAAGLRVETTLDLDLQRAANRAVGDGLAAYERRHGWQGRLENIANGQQTMDSYKHPDWAVGSSAGDYVHALVLAATAGEIRARVGRDELVLGPEDWKWTGKTAGDELVKAGDIVYLHRGAGTHATLEQDSGAQGSLLAIDNTTGDILAMVGGRDYALSQFNRATQAERQTGSSFKPYVYTAAVEAGAKPEDTVLDSPVSFGSYTPHNYENDYKGAMSLTNAFAESRNIPALRLAARVGIHTVIDVAHRFGVTSNIPAYLPVALGAAEITLSEQVASYSVFPNDGIRVEPRTIRRVLNADGIVLYQDAPQVKEATSQQTARTMMTLFRAVTAHGTGAAASQLNHPLGGKTGTTSDYTDAWFLGFSPSVTCGVWVGYDSRQSLGDKETGAKAALPIWMDVMREAIKAHAEEKFLVDSVPANKPESGAKDDGQLPGKPGTAPAARPEAKPAAKPAVRPNTPPQASPVAKPAATPVAKPAARPAVERPHAAVNA